MNTLVYSHKLIKLLPNLWKRRDGKLRSLILKCNDSPAANHNDFARTAFLSVKTEVLL